MLDWVPGGRVGALLGCLAAAVALTACGSSGSGSGGSKSSTSSTTTSSGSTSTAVQPSTVSLTAKFAGVNPGKANPKLAPFVIGFVDQEGGSPTFAEMDHAATASVAFINDHLGGIGGHPLKLDKCVVQAVEDGQKCAAQFVNAHVKIANVGLMVIGNQSFYSTVGGKFPVVVSGEGGAADITTPGAYLFDGGGSAMIGNMAQIANNLGAKRLAIIATSNPAGKYAIAQLMTPAMEKLGQKYKVVYVPDTGTTPDYASALQAAGASTADITAVIPANVNACISTYDALKQLGISKKVVADYTCYGSPWPQHVGTNASGWYFSGFTVNPHVTDNADAAAWRNVMAAYGQSAWTYTGSASKELQDLLLITRFASELGYDSITPSALKAKIIGYKGPGFMVPGTLNCAAAPKATPGICGTGVTASTYNKGTFSSYGAS